MIYLCSSRIQTIWMQLLEQVNGWSDKLRLSLRHAVVEKASKLRVSVSVQLRWGPRALEEVHAAAGMQHWIGDLCNKL